MTSWPADASPELRELAERVLTAKQLEVVKLLAAGYSERRIAILLDLSRGAVRERLDAARRRMQAEIDRLDIEAAERELLEGRTRSMDDVLAEIDAEESS